MARIYIARTTGIGSFERHVVLKMILPERAADKHSVDMFLDEARLAAALNHQNVAQVFEVGQENGAHYLAMEYVHGQDLRAVLSKAGQVGARIPIELSLAIVAGAAAGLHHAHDRKSPDGVPLGIVHRDVSPSNIMIGYDGAVKLLDFGIAKATARSHETQSGIIKGKFAYMSPEQCRGREVDRRSDVFSLGIILYEITTQHRCFRADSDFDTMHRIVTGDIVRPSRLVATYPLELEKIVMTALAVDSSRRYASAAALLEELESFAAKARLSPSTMALGRFMRELFGEVQEPWLTEGRAGSAGGPPRENTVSNTLGAHARYSAADEPSQQISLGSDSIDEDDSVNEALRNANLPSDTWPPKEGSRSGHTWAGKPSSRARGTGVPQVTPSGMSAARPQAASTLLDMPRGGAEAEDAVDWDAKEYPQAQPTFASQLEVSVERKPSLHGHADHAAIMTTLPGPGSAGSASATGTGPSPLAQGNHAMLSGPVSGQSGQAGSSGNTGMSAPFGSPASAGGMTPLSTTLSGTGSSGSRASGSSTLRTTGPRRAFGTTQSQPVQQHAPSGAARSATSQPLSMPSMTPLSSDGKTSTASALAALPLGTSAFSSMEVSAEKQRADSLAADLRPKRRVLVIVMVVVLVAAFAALLVIALGGGEVDNITPQVPQTNATGVTESGADSTATGTATGAVDTGSAGATVNGGSDSSDASNAGSGAVNGVSAVSGDGSAGSGSDAGSGSAGATVPVVPTTGGSGDIKPAEGEGSDRTVPSPVTMHLQVTSDPKGAEVFLGGKRLGLTPLSVFLPKRPGSATLTVRRQRFVEASAKIDLSSPEVTKSFSLRRAPERREREDGGSKDAPCQRPESANPFDDTPICGHD